MGTLYLVRHGQASLGADNYDQLSPLGQRQSLRLGQYWAEKGLQFEAVITGTLQRHSQTWQGIAQGAGLSLPTLAWPGLNEYNSEALIQAIHPQPIDKPHTPEAYRQYFRLLRAGLQQWVTGAISPQGMPCYTDFAQGVRDALAHIRLHYQGNVLLVSSGGPIATAIAQVIGLAPENSIELNMSLRNSAITELRYTPKRHTLLSFNTLPHLDGAQWADGITYA
jgi:broad specificity phosphatase PhoE